MGCTPNITADRYPRQGAFLGRTVEVCFDYDTSATMRGKVIRDDAEAPGKLSSSSRMAGWFSPPNANTHSSASEQISQ